MGAYENPDVADFKEYFVRDFTYGSTSSTVMDSDITKAEQLAGAFINEDLYTSQENYTVGYLLLSAHYLVMDLRASSQGLQGQFPWMQTSKSVGNVSEAFQIPERIMENPEYAWFTKTYYGTQFLMLILPQLTGQVFVVYGRTLP